MAAGPKRESLNWRYPMPNTENVIRVSASRMEEHLTNALVYVDSPTGAK